MPRAVYLNNGIYYFYWLWDGYKPFDYEPVFNYDEEGSLIVVSRFHWRVATVWFDPFISNEKTSVAFVKAIHTPIIRSVQYERFLALNSDDDSEIIEVFTSYMVFNKLMENPADMFLDIPIEYGEVNTKTVPEKYRLDLGKIHSMVVVGRFRPQFLPKELKKIVNYE